MTVRMDRVLRINKTKGGIEMLPKGKAFEVGVEWATEIFFFYGAVAMMSYWSLQK